MIYTDIYTQDNLGLSAHCNALLSGCEYRDVYQTAGCCVGTRYKSQVIIYELYLSINKKYPFWLWSGGRDQQPGLVIGTGTGNQPVQPPPSLPTEPFNLISLSS